MPVAGVGVEDPLYEEGMCNILIPLYLKTLGDSIPNVPTRLCTIACEDFVT